MPSLLVKSNMDGVKERSSLRVCQKSSLICKRSCSHAKISHLAAELSTCMYNCHCANEETEVIQPTHSQGLLSEQNCQTKELQATFIAPAMEGKESTPFSCPSKYETIFSPVMSTFYVHSSEEIHDDEGSNIDSDPSNLTEADESDGNSGSSYENQTCSASDFYISDMVLATFPSDDIASLCDSVVRVNPFLVYDTAASNIFFDTDEGSMNLPFVDDSVDFINFSNTQPSRGTEIQSEDSSFLLAIHHISPSDAALHDGACARLEHAECFDSHSFIRNLPELSDAPACQPTMLTKDSLTRKPVTLVLDLDETLVHSTLEYCEDADFTFTVFYNMKEQTVYVKKRPHLRTFLERVAELFEIIIFTASQSIYAAQLLDILDPDGKLISGRVYRESCIFSDGTYTKDLTVLGVDLAKVVIVDNSPQVFRLQVNNGIPIKSWFHDPSDSELISLIPFLETLVDADDVRPIIAEKFGNKG